MGCGEDIYENVSEKVVIMWMKLWSRQGGSVGADVEKVCLEIDGRNGRCESRSG